MRAVVAIIIIGSAGAWWLLHNSSSYVGRIVPFSEYADGVKIWKQDIFGTKTVIDSLLLPAPIEPQFHIEGDILYTFGRNILVSTPPTYCVWLSKCSLAGDTIRHIDGIEISCFSGKEQTRFRLEGGKAILEGSSRHFVVDLEKMQVEDTVVVSKEPVGMVGTDAR